MSAPLTGLLVIDLSQFLAGPYASLRLADLGARVIKVERPDGGDLCRRLYFSDTDIDGDSTIFHAINRGKESIALDLKNERDASRLRKLIARADVLIQNFRPGVIARLGFDYEAVAAINPRLIYASISGYGGDGAWRQLPGQDLLAQALSGAMWLNGGASEDPVPFGLPVADVMAGANAAHGILAALVRRGISGEGAHVETSLLEALVDFQFEVLATHLNDGGRLPKRAAVAAAHVGLPSPYGVYRTADGHLALAMTPLDKLATLLGSEELRAHAADATAAFRDRDNINAIIARILAADSTDNWLARFRPADIWCAPVLSWPALLKEEAFRQLDLLHSPQTAVGHSITLVRSPIRINGARPRTANAAPEIGADNNRLIEEFNL